MLEQNHINKIKEATSEFFEKMTMPVSSIEANLSVIDKKNQEEQASPEGDKDAIDVDVKLEEPQILIGQGGQTLFEVQRILKTILNKKLGKVFFFNLDINDYKKKKVEYLKGLAKELADQVALDKEEKVLLPMSAYERRVVHAELSQRTDVVTESHGEGFDRHIVIKPK